MAIQKTIIQPPYYIPLSYHTVHEFCVHKSAGVVVANLCSYFSAEAAGTAGVQPLMKSAIQIVGVPDVDIETWILNQLVIAESEEVPVVSIMDRDKYPWASGFTHQNRFFFSGGTVI